jgi:sarcosine oxidase subunit alpha
VARRLVSLRCPVQFRLDDEPIEAEKGEPLAFALLASDRLGISRSPKLHRPHGPYCLRGGCDGCVARVNGEPNVMTCLVPCEGGETVVTQNVLGSRRLDLMQVTDWFFPQGIDHHHFLAGMPAASFVVQKLARHLAGVGRLPDEARPPGTADREEVDVLIVGAGLAGLTIALDIAARRPARVLVVDDAMAPGGSLRARGAPVPELTSEAPKSGTTPSRAAQGARPAHSIRLYPRTTALGIYDGEVLLGQGDHAIVVRPRALVLATGAHDGVLPFPGNDLPGVLSARAGALLAQHGIAIGSKVAVWGDGPYAQAFLDATRGQVEPLVLPRTARVAAEGTLRINAIAVKEGSERPNRASVPPRGPRRRGFKHHVVDALLVEARGAPSFELAEQAGARVAFDPRLGGYVPVVDERGRAFSAVWCAGELAGTGPDLSSVKEQAMRVARDVAASL